MENVSKTIIVFEKDEFKELLRDCLSEILKDSLKIVINELQLLEKNPIKENGGVELAEEILNRSYSWIAKAACQNIIPCKRFGGKLVFNRSELELWLKNNTTNKRSGFLKI
jgi:hypothetical protein